VAGARVRVARGRRSVRARRCRPCADCGTAADTLRGPPRRGVSLSINKHARHTRGMGMPWRRHLGHVRIAPAVGRAIKKVLLPTEGREAHGRPGRIVVLEATKRGRPWPKWIV